MAESRVPPATDPAPTAADAVQPLLPKWAYRIVNPAIAAILRSPWHRLLSHALMLLSFHGRRSGKRYTIPVGYLQQGKHLYLFAHAGWWKNLPGQPVTIRLRGKTVRGLARQLEDREEIAAVVRLALAQRGETMARRMGLLEYADPDRPGLLPPRTRFFAITLDEPAG